MPMPCKVTSQRETRGRWGAFELGENFLSRHVRAETGTHRAPHAHQALRPSAPICPTGQHARRSLRVRAVNERMLSPPLA